MTIHRLSPFQLNPLPSSRNLAICLMLFVSTSAFCADMAWKKVKEADGISVYSRPVAGAKFSEFKSETVFNANLQQCSGFFMNVPDMPKWMYGAKKVELLSENKPLENELYMAMNLPFPLKDRDAHVKAWLTQNADNSVVYAMELLPTKDTPENYVHLKTLHVRMTLTPVAQDKTRVEYVALIDPGGIIPGWANYLFTDAPYQSMKNARKLLEQTKQNVVFASVKNGF